MENVKSQVIEILIKERDRIQSAIDILSEGKPKQAELPSSPALAKAITDFPKKCVSAKTRLLLRKRLQAYWEKRKSSTKPRKRFVGRKTS